MKAILIRLDKIGDLVCTLPVDQMPELSDYETTWVIAKGMGFIAEAAVPPRRFIELSAKEVWQSFQKILKFLRTENFDMAISFQAPWWISLALWWAGVPKRIGVYSQWHSFLFFNQGLRQKRSLSLQHESEYNADLVRHLHLTFNLTSNSKSISTPVPILKLQASATGAVKKYLQDKKYFVVHPGMAGSARNWTSEQYIELIEKIKKINPVVITGTTADEKWLTEIKSRFQNDSTIIILQNQLNSLELLDILAHAEAVIAPSTGVLHLAASLGIRSYGIYSPIRVQHPQRWSARGPAVKIFVPTVKCPSTFQCLGPSCNLYDCMHTITPEQISQTLGN